jgi:hypothetical protein
MSSSTKASQTLRDSVVVLALMGGCLDLFIVYFGPDLAGVTDQPGFELADLRLDAGLIAAVIAIGAGIAVGMHRSALWSGVVLIAAAIAGSLLATESTGGTYPFGAFFSLLAGILALVAVRRSMRQSTG